VLADHARDTVMYRLQLFAHSKEHLRHRILLRDARTTQRAEPRLVHANLLKTPWNAPETGRIDAIFPFVNRFGSRIRLLFREVPESKELFRVRKRGKPRLYPAWHRWRGPVSVRRQARREQEQEA